MSGSYQKPYLSYREQVDLLQARGMEIPTLDVAEAVLRRVGYYRLSGYWFPYRELDQDNGRLLDTFRVGTTFNQVYSLYEMDRRLKIRLLECIERIEIAARVKLGHTLGRRSPRAHLECAHLDGRFCEKDVRTSTSAHRSWIERAEAAQRNSKEDFVEHFNRKYGGQLPVWVATEIMDFGLLSKLYAGSKRADRDGIARDLLILDRRGQGNGRALANWLRVVNYIRNICAHHSRLWNRNMTVMVAEKELRSIPKLAHVNHGDAAFSRVYAALCVIAYLMDKIDPEYPFAEALGTLIYEGLRPALRSPTEMGFPTAWSGDATWALS